VGDVRSVRGELASSLVSNRTVQAAGLVGRAVLVESGQVTLAEKGGTIAGAVDLPETASLVRVHVVDDKGQVVRTIDLGDRPSGLARFAWDGTVDGGDEAPAGTYSLNAEYSDGEGMVAAKVLVEAPV